MSNTENRWKNILTLSIRQIEEIKFIDNKTDSVAKQVNWFFYAKPLVFKKSHVYQLYLIRHGANTSYSFSAKKYL